MPDSKKDTWAADPDATLPAGRRGAGTERGLSVTQQEQARQIAREQIVRGWEEVGVEFSTFKGRQEHGLLLQWIRERREKREAGAGKLVTATIGAAVSALFAGAIAYLTGKHP